jgi:hypothetical protein
MFLKCILFSVSLTVCYQTSLCQKASFCLSTLGNRGVGADLGATIAVIQKIKMNIKHASSNRVTGAHSYYTGQRATLSSKGMLKYKSP